MNRSNRKSNLRERRKKRIRKKISGTTERPRLSVFRSAKNVYLQVIDDTTGKTMIGLSSIGKAKSQRANAAQCTELGKQLAEKCKQNNINTVVFDRNGYVYHGRVKAIAEGAREAGLKL